MRQSLTLLYCNPKEGSREILLTLPGISEEHIDYFLLQREQLSGFKSWDEVKSALKLHLGDLHYLKAQASIELSSSQKSRTRRIVDY